MTTHFIHGFNVSDGGRATVRQWAPYFPVVQHHNYGWTGLVGLRCANARAVDDIVRHVKPGDTLVGHSNGALICWEVAQRCRPGAVIVINPAMRRDTRWPSKLPVLCLHSSSDWVVQLGRVWSRLVSLGGLTPHGWGAAGRYGFTAGQANVTCWDMAESYWQEDARVHSHSGAFKGVARKYWGQMAATWARWVR